MEWEKKKPIDDIENKEIVELLFNFFSLFSFSFITYGD